MVDVAPGAHVSRIEPATRHETHAYDREHVTPVRPLDRVRWPAVIAGLFGTLSLMTVLGVLGVAIGASVYDANDQWSNFGIGAGWWTFVTMVLAFGLGGYIAAGCAALRGQTNALVQGATVWMLTVGLIVYLFAGGLGAMLTTGTTAAADVASGNAGGENGLVQQAQTTLNQTNVDSQTAETAADNTASAAWWTLLMLLVALGAALGGSMIGKRREHDHDHVHGNRDYDANTAGANTATVRS